MAVDVHRIQRSFWFAILVCALGAVLGSTATAQPFLTQPLFRRSDVNVGTGPSSVAVGDFNLDGNPDLAVANSASNNVAILLGNGDGTFRVLAPNIPVGSRPSSVDVGDFNGDGLPDLAVADAASGDLSILIGNGDGTFSAVSPVTIGGQLLAVAAADFNFDGLSDLAVANASTGTVIVLLSNGDGTFSMTQTAAVGIRPAAIAIADLNLDGIFDLVVANNGSNNVSVLLGIGDGTFSTAQNFQVAGSPTAVAISDFNFDGVPDLAAPVGSGNVSILLGNGDGTFGAAQNFAVGRQPTSIAVGDFDGDGRPDIAVTNNDSASVAILFGTGTGRFSCANNVGVGQSPQAIVAADFRSIGKSDLAVANGGSNSLSTLLNTRMVVIERLTFTSGGFNSQAALSSDGNRMAFVSDRDLVGGNPDGNPEIFLWIQDYGFAQITNSRQCVNDMPSISDNGMRIAFSSNCDLLGTNPDGNREIFLAELLTLGQPPGITQITNTEGGGDVANFQPSLSKTGTRIAFSSSRGLVGPNPDGSHQIFLWLQNAPVPFVRITNSRGQSPGTFANFQPSTNGDGTLIAFSSDRNLVGRNLDGNREIFLWSATGGLRQITNTPRSTMPNFDNYQPVLSTDGRRIAFTSNRDLVRRNPNADHQIFLWTQTALAAFFTQITNSTGGGLLANAQPAINDAGTSVAFISNRPLVGLNCDAHDEIYLWREGIGITQITMSTGRESVPNRFPSVNGLGTIIGFSSKCDLVLPPMMIFKACDGNEEMYRAPLPPPSDSDESAAQDLALR